MTITMGIAIVTVITTRVIITITGGITITAGIITTADADPSLA